MLMSGLALFIWLSEVQLEDFFNKVMDIQELLLSWALKTDVQLNLREKKYNSWLLSGCSTASCFSF